MDKTLSLFLEGITMTHGNRTLQPSFYFVNMWMETQGLQEKAWGKALCIDGIWARNPKGEAQFSGSESTDDVGARDGGKRINE